ncbi:MAG: histidine phosphatase family protein [Deltaproteobacteria bacterium]|nr:histidine phosphatase family protein [Deltaproteobacteria bacterium]
MTRIPRRTELTQVHGPQPRAIERVAPSTANEPGITLPALEPGAWVAAEARGLVIPTALDRLDARIGLHPRISELARGNVGLRAVEREWMREELASLDRSQLLALQKLLLGAIGAVPKLRGPPSIESVLALMSTSREHRGVAEGAVLTGVLAGRVDPLRLGLLFSVVDPSVGSVRFRREDDVVRLKASFEAHGTHLISVRHGKSAANAHADTGSPMLSGQSEAKLTDEGKLQAEKAAAETIAALGGDAWLIAAAKDPSQLPVVYASTLSRADDTAAAFVEAARARARALAESGAIDAKLLPSILDGLYIRPDFRLLEMDYGAFEYKTLDMLTEALPNLRQSWDGFTGLGLNFTDRFPGGESRLDVLDRVRTFLEEVAVRHAGRTVLTYCHLETLAMAKLLMGDVTTENGQIKVDAKGIKNATPYSLA